MIGVPFPGFDVFQSVFYSHHYFEKVVKESGNTEAKCRMCFEKKKKEVFLKITDNNTKGLLTIFTKARHSFQYFVLQV